MKDHHLLAVRLAPQADVIARERQADVVAEAAHQQMVADQQRVLHGSRRDHAGLHHGAGDQEKCQRHPDPGEQFANQWSRRRERLILRRRARGRRSSGTGEPSAAGLHGPMPLGPSLMVLSFRSSFIGGRRFRAGAPAGKTSSCTFSGT